jgi:hypothetical protein
MASAAAISAGALRTSWSRGENERTRDKNQLRLARPGFEGNRLAGRARSMAIDGSVNDD